MTAKTIAAPIPNMTNLYGLAQCGLLYSSPLTCELLLWKEKGISTYPVNGQSFVCLQFYRYLRYTYTVGMGEAVGGQVMVFDRISESTNSKYGQLKNNKFNTNLYNLT